MSTSRCRSGITRPASLPLRGPLDALDVVVGMHDPHREETFVLLLDRAHRGGTVVAVDGCVTAEQVRAVTEQLTGPAWRGAGVAAVVLATVRAQAAGGPTQEDHLAFAPLRALGEAAGIDVLDWFVMSGDRSWSLAELTDAVPRWRGDR